MPVLPELFSKRVDLGLGDGSHADILMSGSKDQPILSVELSATTLDIDVNDEVEDIAGAE